MTRTGSEEYQNEIISSNSSTGSIQDNVDITVQIDDPPSKLVLVNLDLKETLSKIRKRLEQNSKVKMNDTLSFAYQVHNNNNNICLFAEIAREDEVKIILERIINKKDNILHLNSEPDWKFLKDKLKLEYGRTSTLEKANKRAFTITKDCEMVEIVDGCKHSKIEIDSEEDQIVKNDLLLTADVNVQNFSKLGVSFGSSKTERSTFETNLICTISEYSKVSLKFKLEPDTEFIEEVKNAIKSKEPRNFRKITEEFGQFIPKEVILGGRAYFKKSSITNNCSEKNSNKYDVQASGSIKIERTCKNLSQNINNSKQECLKLIGGSQLSVNNFDESAWVESLRNFRCWSCIKFKDSVSIFQPLPENLRKQILLSIGKKILYNDIEDCTYYLFEYTRPKVFKLNIPENILEILQNKDADCSIFAEILDKKEKDIFNCQIIWSQNVNPKLKIHCIQKRFKRRKCKLKVRWMIIGYDTNFNFDHSDVQFKVQKVHFDASSCQTITKSLNLEYDSSVLCFGIPVLNELDSSNCSLAIGHHFFNDKKNGKIGYYIFSYCLEKNHYVKLPVFNFYILIISNYSNSDDYGILPFQHNNNIKNNLLSFTKSNPLKFISLYSTGESECGPMFLKQKNNKIKIKHIDTSCDQKDCICKNKILKESVNNLKYAFLDLIKISDAQKKKLSLFKLFKNFFHS